jgi:hypothetical protein
LLILASFVAASHSLLKLLLPALLLLPMLLA